MSPSTSPSDGHTGRTICAGRMFSQTGRPSQAAPLRAPNSQSFRPKSALNAVQMSFRAVSSSPAQNIAAGLPPMPPPCRAPTARKGREQGFLSSARAKLPQARQQGRRLGKQTERRDSPRAGFPLPDAFFSHANAKKRERTIPCEPFPLMNDEGRRMTPSPFCAARQVRLRRSYCFGR